MVPQPFLGHYADLVAFAPQQFNPIGLAQSERMKLALVVIEGEGTLISGDDEFFIRPGSIGFVPAGVRRGVNASTRLIALHTVSPPPTAQDHAQVAAQLSGA